MSTESFKIGPGAPAIHVLVTAPVTEEKQKEIEVETVEEGKKKAKTNEKNK